MEPLIEWYIQYIFLCIYVSFLIKFRIYQIWDQDGEGTAGYVKLQNTENTKFW